MREAAPAQIGDGWRESYHSKGRIIHRRVYQDLVPVDAHVGYDAHLTARTQKLSAEIGDDRLRTPDRDADVLDHGLPTPVLVFHLQCGKRQRFAALRGGEVVAGPGVV